ncbi:DNA methyltransferase [Paenibacillus selenitireducens]|uniref:site-specific DNA-methyltransferase (adenine-specific) n=1 Tax=Paenibacillus selenitireducens TaxID=1324314 RepID=A0A1T2XCF5_9BACL|nr:DNA adenine methylase [Paenibacillus selenitireducens]OPA77452.1 DNA methyltransferase [Paenibacillus selenitireducens]
MTVPRILHYPGSKWNLAQWIIDHMPQHGTYLEPFFGSGAVFFNKPSSKIETVNDMDGDVVNLFKVIRDRADDLIREVEWTPYSREEYYASYEPDPEADELERARMFLVRCWMARGGKTSDRTGWKHNIDASKCPNSNMPIQWSRVPERISMVTDRLRGVQIEQQAAVDLIKRYNNKDVLIYADPPYILSTRSKRLYKHEMKDHDHIALLEVLDDHPGPVLLSGYAHELYDERLKHWTRETKSATAEMGRIRTEVLWINPVAAEQMGQLVMNL